jgi:transposase-like protein
MAQLSSDYGVHANQIRQWRQKLLDELPGMFSDRRQKKDKDTEEVTSELYRQLGQLKVELDWLKKIPTASAEQKRKRIEPGHDKIPASRHCDLLFRL